MIITNTDRSEIASFQYLENVTKNISFSTSCEELILIKNRLTIYL